MSHPAISDDDYAFGADPEPDLLALPEPARRALAALLNNRFITRDTHRYAWDPLIDHEERIRAALANIFLTLVLDRDYEVAFTRQSEDSDAPVMLRRDRPLTREATFLLIHMRQLHTYTDSHDDPVLLTLDAITEFLAQFRDPQDTNDAGFDKTVQSTIKSLTGIGLLTPDPDDDELFIISPAVVPLVSPDVLAAYRTTYLTLARTDPPADDSAEDDDPAGAALAEDHDPTGYDPACPAPPPQEDQTA